MKKIYIFQHLTNKNKLAQIRFRLWTHQPVSIVEVLFSLIPHNGPCGRGGWSCGQGTPWDSLKEKRGCKASPQHWRRPGRSLSTLPRPGRTAEAWSPAGWQTRAGNGPNNAAASSDSDRSAETRNNVNMEINLLFLLWDVLWRVYNNPNHTWHARKKNTATI